MGEIQNKQMKLPNFIIIGAPRAGTTSLYHYLNEHPQVFMSPIKEPKFFLYQGKQNDASLPGMIGPQYFHATSLQGYIKLFKGAKDEPIIGEASPQYFVSSAAAGRIKEFVPQVKLLAILRNPADRAFSQYTMMISYAYELSSIYDTLKEGTPYVIQGLYYQQLMSYFKVFSKEQLKVCLYEDLCENPASLMEEIYSYLCIDSAFTPNIKIRHNISGGVPKNKFTQKSLARLPGLLVPDKIFTAMIIPESFKKVFRKLQGSNMSGEKMIFPDDLRRNLLDYYREDILKTQELIGRDLTHWLM